MTTTRVLLVDDSAVVRRLVSEALADDPAITVVGAVGSGRAALAQLPDLRPDVIVLDLEMPEMDGLQTLAAVRAVDPRLPVIMFSTETRRGAAVTLDALAHGASDYLTKPVDAGGVPQALEYIRTELGRKIKALGVRRPGGSSGTVPPPAARSGGAPSGIISLPGARVAGTSGITPLPGARSAGASGIVPLPGARPAQPPSGEKRPAPGVSGEWRLPPAVSGERRRPAGVSGVWRLPKPASGDKRPAPGVSGERPVPGLSGVAPVTRRPAPTHPVGVVVVGVSTGGPAALADLLPQLPAGFPVPVAVVLHMPPVFTRLLAERLSAACPCPVVEAADGDPVHPGRVYLAPGGYHMTVARGRVSLNQDPPENFCRPAADVLFRSAAREYGPATLAVVLTGMGGDGTKGCELVRAVGGQVIVQDQKTSVIWGMPGSVVRAGLADEILPLDQIVPAVTRRVQVGRAARRDVGPPDAGRQEGRCQPT